MIDWTEQNTEIFLLKATLLEDLAAITEVYAALEQEHAAAITDSRNIALGYYLYRLYTLFETTFLRLVEHFGIEIVDQTQWHAELLRNMATDLLPLRPAVISPESLACLNKLRGFRHFFRSARVLHFDPSQLRLPYNAACQLKPLYPVELDTFLTFLDTLMSSKKKRKRKPAIKIDFTKDDFPIQP